MESRTEFSALKAELISGGEAPALPRTLAEATALFRSSAPARRAFCDEFVDNYAATRDWEVRQYNKAVTDWELTRYFEAV